MPTVPADPEAPPPARERVREVIVSPIERTPPLLAALSIAAGAGSLAPEPFGVIVASVLVPAAWYAARRK